MMDELRTERLRLRPWQLEEADRLFEILRVPGLTAWLGDPKPPATRAEVETMIVDRLAGDVTSALTGNPVRLAIVPDQVAEPVGSVMVNQFPNGDVDIGWYLHPDAEGHGWVTEAASAVIDRLATAPRIWAVMWPNNLGSVAVSQRVGLTDLGVHHDPLYGTKSFPHSRFFCQWHDNADHPLGVLAELASGPSRASASDDIAPPVWRDGTTYHDCIPDFSTFDRFFEQGPEVWERAIEAIKTNAQEP